MDELTKEFKGLEVKSIYIPPHKRKLQKENDLKSKENDMKRIENDKKGIICNIKETQPSGDIKDKESKEKNDSSKNVWHKHDLKKPSSIPQEIESINKDKETDVKKTPIKKNSSPFIGDAPRSEGRPQTSALVAHRMITTALGLGTVKRSEERENYDRAAIRNFKPRT